MRHTAEGLSWKQAHQWHWIPKKLYVYSLPIGVLYNFAAQEAGLWAAGIANQVQERAIREAINKANKAIKRISNIALAMVNKVTLQLMAVLGG